MDQEICLNNDVKAETATVDPLVKKAKLARLFAILSVCLGAACLLIPFLFDVTFIALAVICGLLCLVLVYIGIPLMVVLVIVGWIVAALLEVLVFLCLLASVTFAIVALVMSKSIKAKDEEGSTSKILSLTKTLSILGLIASGIYAFQAFVMPLIGLLLGVVLWIVYVVVMVVFALIMTFLSL